MEEKIIKMSHKLKKELDRERYGHTMGVMYTAAALAMRHGADIQQTLTAGLLHDCAKCLSDDEKKKLCEKYNLSVSEAEQENPSLLHARLGACLAWNKYKVRDRDVLRAIASHTTGRPGMSLLDKIVYIADYIEPGRKELPNMAHIRALAFDDIDECLMAILKDSLDYLKTRNLTIDPMTEKTYDYYKEIVKEQVVERGGNKMEKAQEIARDMARIAVRALDEKKGEEPCVIDVSLISIMTDYFVIAHGNSDSQVRALVDNVDEKMQEAGYTLRQQEGKGGAWVLMDYGDIIVHVFDKEGRAFYNLERIWSDGKIVEEP